MTNENYTIQVLAVVNGKNTKGTLTLSLDKYEFNGTQQPINWEKASCTKGTTKGRSSKGLFKTSIFLTDFLQAELKRNQPRSSVIAWRGWLFLFQKLVQIDWNTSCTHFLCKICLPSTCIIHRYVHYTRNIAGSFNIAFDECADATSS